MAMAMNRAMNEEKQPPELLIYEAYYKYNSLNRLMRYLAMSLGLLESYHRVGDKFRFDAFEPFRDALLQTYLLCQNLLERSQDLENPTAATSTSTAKTSNNGNGNDGNVPKELLHQVERQKLLACVQCLAGCVEFSGVGDEKRYLQMCEEALTELRKVQDFLNRARFWSPGWIEERKIKLDSEWRTFVERVNTKTDAAEKLAERQKWFDDKKDECARQFEQELKALKLRTEQETEDEKNRLRSARAAKIAKWEEEEKKKDDELEAFLSANANADAEKLLEERTRAKEVSRVLFYREQYLEKEKERQEKSRTARARDPVLYRSHGPNSYSASKRPKSANSQQRESDKKPWNPWRLEVSQFLLSASRSIGVLRASGKSEGFRFDAFQPFLGALRDTFQLCDQYLKRNETDELYLTVSERNTLLAALVGLAGCVTFTGVSREEKYGEICKLALEKLEAVVTKLSASCEAAAAAATPPQQLPPQQQQMGYFAQQQTMMQQQQPQMNGGFYGPANSLGYWNEQASSGPVGMGAHGYYGPMPNWPQWPATPVPYPGNGIAPGQYYGYGPQPQQPQTPPSHQ